MRPPRRIRCRVRAAWCRRRRWRDTLDRKPGRPGDRRDAVL